MKVMVELCLVPLGVGVSVSRYVQACQDVLHEAGFEPELHAYGTNFEGEWEEAVAAVRCCHERVHEMGAPRIHSTLKVGTRTDRDQSLRDKVERVSGTPGRSE